MRRWRMLRRIFDYASMGAVAFFVTMILLACVCGGCGGEEDPCLGPSGVFVSDIELSIYNCTGMAPIPPASTRMTVEVDSSLRICGWHPILSKTVLRPDGCMEKWKEDLRTSEKGYLKTVFMEVACGDAKCGAVWEADYREVAP
jgi:hypothetical protein